MADAWEDLKAARTAAQAAEQTESSQLAQLASIEAQLGQITLALAGLPSQLPAAQPTTTGRRRPLPRRRPR